MEIQNYSDLKKFIDTLTPEQLLQPVKVWGEHNGGTIDCGEVLIEDYINPTSEGLEPVSAYSNEPEVLAAESVVVYAGEIRLTLS